MSDELAAGIDRLIDGDLNREERLRLLWALAQHHRARVLLIEAIRLDVEFLDLADAIQQCEPSPEATTRIFDAIAADSARGPLARAMGSVREAFRQMTRMDEAELGVALGGFSPSPDDYDPTAGLDEADASPSPLSGSGRADGAGRSPETGVRPVEGEEGRLRFSHGAGSLHAAFSVKEVDLGRVGPSSEGAWVLRLIAGVQRQAGSNQVEIAGSPDIEGCLVLLDGSSLFFTHPIVIRWDAALDEFV
ncbi:hypothetical protein AZL_a04970 (plasmid) [Azospirillum sp. B510]|uniref:hypothetical protein n=1 Tax=Azospirillum sp. (strain B510) TaxID=137722 RepID=UPI0001C4BC66|nr:hypothetical protein [Azospirillum sp. B510]BAI74028.1 hypothetical protein AZL_a04970 [Azospirillum sp. B510]